MPGFAYWACVSRRWCRWRQGRGVQSKTQPARAPIGADRVCRCSIEIRKRERFAADKCTLHFSDQASKFVVDPNVLTASSNGAVPGPRPRSASPLNGACLFRSVLENCCSRVAVMRLRRHDITRTQNADHKKAHGHPGLKGRKHHDVTERCVTVMLSILPNQLLNGGVRIVNNCGA